MISRERRNTARLVLLRAWKHVGTSAFAVNPQGAHWDPLHDAEKLGWCRFVDDRCRITAAGAQELAPWGATVGEAAD